MIMWLNHCFSLLFCDLFLSPPQFLWTRSPSCVDSVASSDVPTTKTNFLSTMRWRFLASSGHSSKRRSLEASIKRNGPRTGVMGPCNFKALNLNRRVWYSFCLCFITDSKRKKKKSAPRLGSWDFVHVRTCKLGASEQICILRTAAH